MWRRCASWLIGLAWLLLSVGVQAESGRVTQTAVAPLTAVSLPAAAANVAPLTEGGAALPTVRQQMPPFAAPGQVVTVRIWLDNLDTVTHNFELVNVLPDGLRYVPGSATGGLQFNVAQNALRWDGAVGPGELGYVTTAVASLPYVNLGDSASPPQDLCGLFANCDEATAVFDLSPQQITFFGDTLTTLRVNSNGLLLGSSGGVACLACPQPLPSVALPNHLVAGLWRDVDMSNGNGQWYGALLTGWLTNPADTVFYANWHDAGQWGDPFLRSQHAIAFVLDGQSEPNGRFYIIFNGVTDAAALADVGFTIGVEDENGRLGVTIAHAPCAESPCVPGGATGVVPDAPTTWRFDPAIVPGANGKLFTYQAEIVAQPGSVLVNTVQMTSDGPVAQATAVAEMVVDYRTFYPLIFK